VVETAHGERHSARFLVMATGSLTVPKPIDIPGLERFAGRWYHSTAWPQQGVDFTGQRVGIVGTASTGVQMIPLIARQASHLTVFQRTANFVLPAGNRAVRDDERQHIQDDYPRIREKTRYSNGGSHYEFNNRSALSVDGAERDRVYEENYRIGGLAFLGSFNDLLTSEAANRTAADFVRRKIRGMVDDPDLAETLCPRDYPLGAKRLCVGTDYFATYNRDNVTLVDLRRTPLVEITETGMHTAEQALRFDALVFATGFDAITGALSRIAITGRGGVTLRDKWRDGPRSYLGLATAGFPNLFMTTGPGSPGSLANMVVAIEQHVDWIVACLVRMKARGETVIEASDTAELAWGEKVAALSRLTLHHKASSWYTGANIPGKARVFMPFVGGFGNYRRLCDAVAANDYDGFELQ
jgi:cyclohexanone monooxygenase